MNDNSETAEKTGEQKMSINRRTMIGTSLAIATGLAGCSSSGDGGGTTPGGGTPKEVIQNYYTQLNNPNKDDINSLISANGDMDKLTEEDVARLKDQEITLESTEVVSQTEDTAVIKASSTAELNGLTSEGTTEYSLAKQDGRWKIVDEVVVD